LEVLTADLPLKMNTPVIDTVNDILPNSIKITWTSLPDASNGRDVITYYKLEWD